MFPGEGSIDFQALFTRLEGMGYQGHYTNGFGRPAIRSGMAGRTRGAYAGFRHEAMTIALGAGT